MLRVSTFQIHFVTQLSHKQEAGEPRSEVYTLPNLNQTNLGKFFATDAKCQQLSKHAEQGAVALMAEKQAVRFFSSPGEEGTVNTEQRHTKDPMALPSMQSGCCPHLMGVHEVHDKVEVPMHRLVLSQLGLHLVQPVDQGLQGIHELA